MSVEFFLYTQKRFEVDEELRKADRERERRSKKKITNQRDIKADKYFFSLSYYEGKNSSRVLKINFRERAKLKKGPQRR